MKIGQNGSVNLASTSQPLNQPLSPMLTAIGEKGREVYYTFTFTDETEAMEYSTVLQKFDICHRKRT